jgi:predicted NUDIX family NTP pyrophosphohydrolase
MAGLFVSGDRLSPLRHGLDMARRSAGILLYRLIAGEPEVLLVHPGGPFWARKDEAVWSIPKGEYEVGEPPASAALREFAEETGLALAGELLCLGEAVQPSRKVVTAFALEGDLDVAGIHSNVFEMEWPPRSGRRASFPEIDRAGWFDLGQAATKILPGQKVFLSRLGAHLDGTA